jgi:hypothetical protein
MINDGMPSRNEPAAAGSGADGDADAEGTSNM